MLNPRNLDQRRAMLRRMITRSPAAAGASTSTPEPTITAISTRGDCVTLLDTPASPVLLSPFVVRRTGYVMNVGDAAPALTTWDETLLQTKRRITPGGPESNGYVGNEVMTSRVIMAGDTLPNQSGLVNPSTRSAPKIDVRWISQGFPVVGNTVSASATCNSFYTRNGTPVAAMAFVWRDGVGGIVRAFCRVPTAYTGFGVTGYSAHQWAVSGVDISSLADGRITLDWEVYGHYGQLVASNDAAFDTLNATKWFHGRRYMRKHPTMAATPVYAYIRPGNPGPTPQCSTDAAIARANPFTSWQAAHDAADDFNNTTYSLGGPALDGVVFRFRRGGTTDNIIPNQTLSGTTTCQIAGFIVEPDPLDDWVPNSATRPVLEGIRVQLSTSTNPNNAIGFTIRGFDIVRLAQATMFLNPAATGLRMFFEAPPGGGTFDLKTTGLSNVATNAYWSAYGFTFPTTGGMASFPWLAAQGCNGIYDCVISDYENRTFNAHTLICVRGLSIGIAGIPGNGNGTNVSMFHDAVRLEGSTAAGGQLLSFSITGTSNPVVGVSQSASRNSQYIPLNSAEANRMGYSNDAQEYSLRDAYFHHCDVPSACAATRINGLYLDGAAASFGAARDQQYSGVTNSVLPPFACKGEWFGTGTLADVAREPGWREAGYGLGWKGNLFVQHFALQPLGNEIEAQRYPGINSVGSISAGPNRNSNVTPYLNPGWLDPRIPTVTAGANGSPGGDYRHTYTMPAASDADVLFDMAGRTVPLGCVRPGANSGWAL